MRAMILGCCGLCLCGGAFVIGGNHGIDYDGSVAQVHSELASMPMPPELEESIEDGSGAVRTVAASADQIRWHFEVDGHEIGRIAAKLTPVDGDTTNVQVEWEPGDALPKGSNARAVAMQPLVEEVAETFMAEQIDATLEDRPFNKKVVAMQVAAYAASHPREMKQYMAKVQAMTEDPGLEVEEEMGPPMPGESRPPVARFEPGKPMVSARPMSRPSGYR